MEYSQHESLEVSDTPFHRRTVSNLKMKIEMQAALAVHQYWETNSRQRMTCRLQTIKERVLQKGLKFLADLERNAKFRRVSVGILPCVIITKLNLDADIAKTANSDMMMVRRRPARSRRKEVLKDQLLYWRKSPDWLCISGFHSEEVYSTESWKIWIERVNVNFSRGTWHQHKIRERNGPSRWSIQKVRASWA